ncbi:GntR family transcriptional regulator [Nocardia nova]|uniref:GntR family transcriptional regulator n=1 Tax=Nocardia nova TaxID=37330 RepID=UPI001ED991A2|nr:GntR family transcriptional regulator [Nocardia nova]
MSIVADQSTPLRGAGGRRGQLPAEVASYLRELILSGQVRPGEFIRLERIASATGVSTTPVREALLALHGEGLVELVPRRGFVVLPISPDHIRDLFWTQAQFAAELAARAAGRITPEQIAGLEQINRDYDRAVAAEDTERVAALGHAFHREINLAADSYRLTRLLASVVKQLPNRFYASIESQAGSTSDDHRLLAEALRDHDVRQARSLAQRHIIEGADRVLEALARSEQMESVPLG